MLSLLEVFFPKREARRWLENSPSLHALIVRPLLGCFAPAGSARSNEGFLPANLYTLGPPFPSAGKNRTEIARKEHNERLAADNARNSVSSAKCAGLGTRPRAVYASRSSRAASSRLREKEIKRTPYSHALSTLKGRP